MENYMLPVTANETFLKAIFRSFEAFLEKGTSRSTYKLKPLHGAVAKDIADLLGCDYEIWSQGYMHDKESEIKGRYINKKVDIAIKHGGKPVAGIAIKFVMQNYSQNSNNYFENMLGETANIRCAHYPYFQIFIILDKIPYYSKDKRLIKWESFTDHNISKYIALSKDDVDMYLHTPNKTLIYVVHISEPEHDIKTLEEYTEYYRTHNYDISVTTHCYDEFESNVILNDYETFINKVYHTVKSL